MKKIDMDEYKHFEEQFLITQKKFYTEVDKVKEKLAEIQSQIEGEFEYLQEVHYDMVNAKDELDGFLSEQIGEIENYMNEKSEKWLDSDKGEKYTDWKEHIQELSDQLNEGISDTLPDIPEIDTALDDISEYEFEGLSEDYSDINTIL